MPKASACAPNSASAPVAPPLNRMQSSLFIMFDIGPGSSLIENCVVFHKRKVDLLGIPTWSQKRQLTGLQNTHLHTGQVTSTLARVSFHAVIFKLTKRSAFRQ